MLTRYLPDAQLEVLDSSEVFLQEPISHQNRQYQDPDVSWYGLGYGTRGIRYIRR